MVAQCRSLNGINFPWLLDEGDVPPLVTLRLLWFHDLVTLAVCDKLLTEREGAWSGLVVLVDLLQQQVVGSFSRQDIMLGPEYYEILVCPCSLQMHRRTDIVLNRVFSGLGRTESRFVEGLRLIIIIVGRSCCGIPAPRNMILEKFADFKHFLLWLLARCGILSFDHCHTLTPLYGSFFAVCTTADNIILDLTLRKGRRRNTACIHRFSHFLNPPLTYLPSRRSNWVTSNDFTRGYPIICNIGLWIKVPWVKR